MDASTPVGPVRASPGAEVPTGFSVEAGSRREQFGPGSPRAGIAPICIAMLLQLKIEHIGKDIFEWKTNLDVEQS
jgi:hypothetical protein